MGTLRQLKRGKEVKKTVAPVNLKLLEQLAYDRGYNEGAAAQRKSDIECLVDLLEGLEDWPGIGGKTSAKIREHFMSKFGE